MNRRHALLLALALGAATSSGCVTAQFGAWDEGKRYGQWRLAYHGYGEVTGDDHEVVMYPRSAESADVTHACLVLTHAEFEGDLDFAVTVRTEEQVRAGNPNPWEVGWVLWNYQNDEHFYALALKPNGWELSKQDPAYPGNQRFLASGDEPTFPIKKDHRARIIQTGNTIAVYADGALLGTYTDTEDPYLAGALGLYTEDAKVRFRDLQVGGIHSSTAHGWAHSAASMPFAAVKKGS